MYANSHWQPEAEITAGLKIFSLKNGIFEGLFSSEAIRAESLIQKQFPARLKILLILRGALLQFLKL